MPERAGPSPRRGSRSRATASQFTPFIHDPAQGPPATITVNGAVSLSGSLSAAFANFTPAVNTPIVLIDNDGADPIFGEFGTLPEGTEFTSAASGCRSATWAARATTSR